MRKIFAGSVLLFMAAGCANEGGRFNLLRPSGVNPMPAQVATKEDLVDYLNKNSAYISGIQSDDVSLTCYNGGIPVTVSGRLRAQGPRNFRMTADVFGNREVDLGSNNQEFWYWIRQGEKAQVFCSYQALEEGRVKQMPFPFQPAWVLEAMGMGNYGSADKYELVTEPEYWKLIERTKSPQGQPVKKIIVFNRRSSPANSEQPQIKEFLLQDEATGKTICSAHITRKQKNYHTLPREMELKWPAQNLTLKLRLDGVQVNQQIPPQVFARTRLNGVPSFDLETGRIEAIQQAGGPKGSGIPR